MNASVTLEQGMTFEGSADSGYTVRLGASPSVGGNDDGFRPMELMLLSLAGCTAMDVISILRKKRQHITGLQVTADATMAREHPKVFTHITLRYIVQGMNVERAAVERSIELSTTKYCPATAMLSQAVPIDTEYDIIEEKE